MMEQTIIDVRDNIRFRAINHLFSVSDSYCVSMALSMVANY